MSVVIGIAGGSGSGKTTVQRRVMERFGTRRIALLDHDAYYHDLAHLAPEQRARFNFDHPDALETDLLVDHLDRLLAGEAVEKPTYSFETHRRRPETETVEPRPVILVDGILVLAEPALRVRMDVSSTSTPRRTSALCGGSSATSTSAGARSSPSSTSTGGPSARCTSSSSSPRSATPT